MARELSLSLTPKDKSIREDHFRAGGKGGQNQNVRSTGVRFTHLPSGAVGESREERSQLQNRKVAWGRMADHPRFRYWVSEQNNQKENIEKKVEEAMQSQNLLVEYRSEGRWVPAE